MCSAEYLAVSKQSLEMLSMEISLLQEQAILKP